MTSELRFNVLNVNIMNGSQEMDKSHNWIVQLCDYHAIKFNSDYLVSQLIKEAIRERGKCGACLIDAPLNIMKVDITLIEEP